MGKMTTYRSPPDSVIIGSDTMLINEQPAALMGDQTAHGGIITVGFPQVLMGG